MKVTSSSIVLCALTLSAHAVHGFTPPNLFCATADGQIACNLPCPEISTNGNSSEYCTSLNKEGSELSDYKFKYCFETMGELEEPGTTHCPSTFGGKCADIGKTCNAPVTSSASECPTSGKCGDNGGPECDGTCGCGCAFAKMTTWLGFPSQEAEGTPTSCGYGIFNAASIYMYCV
jgi:hypothetical protein